MSTQTLLVELGTEELPPKALKQLSEAFTAGVEAGLSERRLAYGGVRSYATPRRLAVLVEELANQAEDESVELFGPPADKARLDDGSWSPAAIGFARKQQVEPEALEVAETEKGPRLVYRSKVSGARADQSIQEILAQVVRDLPIPKRMRWGSSRREFVRPVHWLVAMLDDGVVECTLLELAAGRQTRGHRFHSRGPLTLKSASDYESLLEDAHVIADFTRRREIIRQQVMDQAKALNATAVIDDSLLDEVTALVEWPVALTGSFEERFLQVPAEALISSMKEHQKYFHVVDGNGQLLPHFITVANIESRDPEQVIDGNERVIRPRLSDADFFFNSDKQIPLAARVDRLRTSVFQQALGTLFDKSRRLMDLSGALARETGANPEAARRAAELCKTDLLTLMVGEFADLQGVAGRYYALHDGETASVANAIEQHYWPRFAGDRLPDDAVATTLALADRLDTLVGIFGIGQAPTGSRDPFALRRASLGVLRILVEKQLPLDLRVCLHAAYDQYPAGLLAADTVEQVLSYMLDRFRAWYEDSDIPVEVFKSVSAKGLSVPLDIDRRVHAVQAFAALAEASALASANKRVTNILSKQASDFKVSGVSKDLLSEPAEIALAEAINEKQPGVDQDMQGGLYTEALTSLADLQSPVDAFFDQVMVMADDDAIRQNRLNLLAELRGLFLEVADISQLAPGK